MTHTIPLLHPLDDPGLHHRESARVLAPADLSRHYHPLFVRVEPAAFGSTRWLFSAFTGREPEPELPDAVYEDKSLTWEQRGELSTQYQAARIMWSHARLRLQAAPLLRRAAPLWEAWTAATSELRCVFKEFWETEDGRWRAQLLRLTDAESAARSAAAAWDAVAETLAQLAAEQIDAAGYDDELELVTVARELGLDASSWRIAHIDAYTPSYWRRTTPLVTDLIQEIKEQRDRLHEIAQFVGESEPVA